MGAFGLYTPQKLQRSPTEAKCAKDMLAAVVPLPVEQDSNILRHAEKQICGYWSLSFEHSGKWYEQMTAAR